MRRLIFSKANHQLESRIQEIWQSGSEGGAKPTFVPTPIATPKSRPVGYGVIRAGVRTDSMIGVTKFRTRTLKTFMFVLFLAYEISHCEGRSIDKGRIIGLDSSNLSKPPKLCLATGLWRIERWYLAASGNGPLHRAAARTSSDTNLSRRVFSLP